MKNNKTTNAKRNHHTSVFQPTILGKTIIASFIAGSFGIACAEDGSQLKEIDVTADAPGYLGDSAESTSKTATPLKDLPASIQVVPNQVLRDRGVTRTNQLLENVSGVLAESSYGGNGATFFNIRGFSESNGLRDGFRNFGYYAFRDVQNIEQVEVFKGPAGALYGGVGAVGGYINTVSKRPQKDNFGEVGITADSNGLIRKTIDVNRVLDNDVSVRLNGAVDQSATFRDNGGYDSWSIAPSISWDNRQGTSLTLLTELNHLNRNGFDLGIPSVANYQALSRTRYYGLANGVYPGVAGDYGKNDTDSATLLFEHVLNEDWKLRMAAHYTYAHQLSTQTFPNSTVATGNLLDYSVYSGADEASKQYAVQAELSGTFSAGGFRHSLLTGIDYGYLEQGGRGSTVSTITVDLLNPNYVSALTPAGSTSSHQGQGKDFGVYVQDMIDLAPQWKLLAAMRADRFINRALVSDAETSSNSQTVFSPRAGLVWQPTDRTSIFTDWSRSHSPNVGHSANENTFDAEIAEQTELGIKHELIKDTLNATLAIFDLKRSNILTTDPNDSTRQILSGRQESRGIEFDLVGTITPDWKVIASYTYTNAVVKSDLVFPVGDHLSNVPRHHASLWNSYGFNAIPGLSAGVGVYYIGEREANLPNTFKLPGYVRTDAALTYQRNAWRTQLNIFNMFNRKYYTGGSAGVFNYTLDPSPPLTAQLTITYRF
jgi:iron complex outermembrane recepter protein